MVTNNLTEKQSGPQGVLLTRTLAMPSDRNPNGDVFGGWMMSQMDIGGTIYAKEIALGRAVTVAVENINFIRPAKMGDVICCYGQCLHVGRSSIKIKVEAWVNKIDHGPIGETYCVADGVFVFVALDVSTGKPREIPREGNQVLKQALAQQN